MKERPFIRISATGLRISYAHFVAFEADKIEVTGNIIAVIGHNGAGKSTLIKSLLGLLTPQMGSLEVTYTAENVKGLLPEQDMAFCPENGSVFADIAVERYLELWCRIRHHDARYYRKKCGSRYVELLDIGPLLKKKGRELSKGQRRRVQTALGFMIEPKLFLFDEPFDGLDVGRTNQLMEILEEERYRRCFIVSSHRMDVVERVADTVVVLKQGRLQSAGSVDQVCRELLASKPGNKGGSLTDAMRYHLTVVGG